MHHAFLYPQSRQVLLVHTAVIKHMLNIAFSIRRLAYWIKINGSEPLLRWIYSNFPFPISKLAQCLTDIYDYENNSIINNMKSAMKLGISK